MRSTLRAAIAVCPKRDIFGMYTYYIIRPVSTCAHTNGNLRDIVWYLKQIKTQWCHLHDKTVTTAAGAVAAAAVAQQLQPGALPGPPGAAAACVLPAVALLAPAPLLINFIKGANSLRDSLP